MTTPEPDWYGEEPKAPPRAWDFLLTLLFVVLMGAFVVVFATVTLGSGATFLCTGECDLPLINLGHLIALYAPSVVALVTTIWSVGRLVRRRIAFGIALFGLAATVGVFLLGRLLFDLGVAAG